MHQRAWIVIIVFGLLALGATAWRLLSPAAKDSDRLSGYIEAQVMYLAAPLSGNVTDVGPDEGARVQAGARLFTVDPRVPAAQLAQARAQLAAARASEATAVATVRQEEANLAAAEAALGLAEREDTRYSGAAAGERGAVSVQETDRSASAARQARAARNAAAAQVQAGGSQASEARAQTVRALATVDEAAARLDQMSVRAPATGRIERVYFQRGEWVSANQPIVGIIPDAKVKVRFFAPESSVSLYRPGGRVQFDCDSCGSRRTAQITYVSPSPEYTPPVIFSRSARDRLMFLIEALPDHPDALNPGQPVEVIPIGAAGARP